MRYKKLIALPILALAMIDPALAGAIPNITAIPALGGAPAAIDYTFDNRGLTVSLQAGGANGYVLTATGAGNFTFYGPTPGTAYSGVGTSYALTANFDSAGHFYSAGSSLSITGALSSYPSGATAPTSPLLYAANLVDFGINQSQSDLGFRTAFLPSWANQPLFTGGSTGELVYLFDQGGLLVSNAGLLSNLVNAFAAGDLSTVAGTSYVGAESLATVPLPLPAILFGTGLTALMGFGRQRRNGSK